MWNIQGAGIVVYLVVFGINAGLFLVFGQYGDLIERQNDQRKETIDELALANEGWSGRWPRTPRCTTSSSSRPATRG